ncbi:oligopeptide/dipeptide ABC transporter ATP-binding protein [Clostridium ljungdahlii]|uniref:oligopeptide/dipeptide ABC transporter ATP-binding protein n=1 Tax=Clostridium ljungdahlii TaxID=1538 RepID=UPI003862D863
MYKGTLASVFSVKKRENTEIEIIKGEPPSSSDIQPGCSFNSRCTKCRDICFKEKPELKEIEKGHLVACHLSDE